MAVPRIMAEASMILPPVSAAAERLRLHHPRRRYACIMATACRRYIEHLNQQKGWKRWNLGRRWLREAGIPLDRERALTTDPARSGRCKERFPAVTVCQHSQAGAKIVHSTLSQQCHGKGALCARRLKNRAAVAERQGRGRGK
jgi:hypothetical protein